MSRRLVELSGDAVRSTLTEDSVVILPTGSIEHHGPHLPLNTDALLAETLAAAAVERGVAEGLDLWLLPTLTYMPEPSWSRQCTAVSTQRAAITVPEQLKPW